MLGQVLTRVIHPFFVILQLRQIKQSAAVFPIEKDLGDDAAHGEHVH